MDAQKPASLLELVHVPQPCYVPWNAMAQMEGKRRFCQDCKKAVHDFNAMTTEEVIALLQSDPGNICGNYRELRIPAELVEKQPKVQPSKKRNSIRYAAAFASVLALIQQPKSSVLLAQNNPSAYVDQPETKPNLAEGNTLVTGTVIDQYGNLVTENVELSILRDGVELAHLQAHKGLFFVDLSEKACSEDSITVQVLPYPKPVKEVAENNMVAVVTFAANQRSGTSKTVLLAEAQNVTMTVQVNVFVWNNAYLLDYVTESGGTSIQLINPLFSVTTINYEPAQQPQPKVQDRSCTDH
jgi:hypothetical protein